MEQLNDIADKLKMLGDKTRLTILTLLKTRDLCVCELVDILGVSQPGISQHLRKLKSHGLVSESRRGQWVYYSLTVEDKPYIRGVLEHMPDLSNLLPEPDKPGAACKS